MLVSAGLVRRRLVQGSRTHEEVTEESREVICQDLIMSMEGYITGDQGHGGFNQLLSPRLFGGGIG